LLPANAEGGSFPFVVESYLMKAKAREIITFVMYFLLLTVYHFPRESRDINWGFQPDTLGELPHIIAGELPCISFCFNYERDVTPYLEVTSVCLLRYHVVALHSELFRLG
jgi:hypothetical protein